MKTEIYFGILQDHLSSYYKEELADTFYMNAEYGLYHFKATPKGKFVPVYVWRYRGKKGSVSLVLDLTAFTTQCLRTYVRLRPDTSKLDASELDCAYVYENDFVQLRVPVTAVGIVRFVYSFKEVKGCLSLEDAQAIWRIQMWNEPMMYENPVPELRALKNGRLGLGYGYIAGDGHAWFIRAMAYEYDNGFALCSADDFLKRSFSNCKIIQDENSGLYFELENNSFRKPRLTRNISKREALNVWQQYLLHISETNKKRFKKISSYPYPMAIYRGRRPYSGLYEPCWLLGTDDKFFYMIDVTEYNQVCLTDRQYRKELIVAYADDKNFIE